ncbi:nuclear transport factor 2 family protein [Psychromonas sp. KJ10-10]|uniref:nuclear transport factor 2 family protein n=1 Tax=Psychromonas sp. KJ10-10 TaxID=3391823 RepID=UPI0039B6851C
MGSPLLEKFCHIYQNLDRDNLDQLKEVYSEQIEFVDAVEKIKGLSALTAYFQHLYENMHYCRFIISDMIEQEGQACLVWRMEYAHQKINAGEMVTVEGCSFLVFSEKIDFHRDYVDMGQMLYEHIPLVGRVIKGIKNRVRT